MDKPLFGSEVIQYGDVYLRAVLCADGFYRWSVSNFNEVERDTPVFISHKDLHVLETTTEISENPEMWEGE